jgi:hypothetical protein
VPSDDPIGAALFGGAVTAIAAAIAWSLLVGWTEYEAKWFAVGLGALVGFVMSRMTTARGHTVALYAAMLAAFGLAAGKLLSVRSAYVPVAREVIVQDEQALTVAVAFDMFAREQYSPDLQHELYRFPVVDSIPPEMVERMMEEAAGRLETAPPAERQRVVQALLDSALARVTLAEQFTAVLGFWDVIWFLAAIGAAWKIMKGD